MARTRKDKAYRLTGTVEYHIGCQNDPTHRKRLVERKLVTVEKEHHWHPKTMERLATGHYMDCDSRRDWRYCCGKLRPAPGTEWVFGPTVEYTVVDTYEVVECDIDKMGGSCRRFGGRGHRCKWPKGSKQSLWYAPERAASRDEANRARATFNTDPDLIEDFTEASIPSSPSGLWGGGWVD